MQLYFDRHCKMLYAVNPEKVYDPLSADVDLTKRSIYIPISMRCSVYL